MMKLLSIQIGKPQDINFRGKTIRTGIFKTPIGGPVLVRTTNLDGDGQADLSVHGGIHKAVYGYAVDTFREWKSLRPEHEFTFGAFGENLSLETLREDRIFVGDKFSLGDAVLQAVQPRFPCFKLGVKFDDPSILKSFMKFQRPGVYFAVLREGLIEAGQELKLIEQEQREVSITDVFRFVRDGGDPEQRRRILAVPSLPPNLREQLES